MENNNNYLSEFTKGIFKENPVFIMLLGLCPALAISSMIVNGISMGIATTFVLIFSNISIASLKNFIPDKIRIPAYIIIIAFFVTIVDLFLKAYIPFLAESLGIFVPLIAVNCIILGRAEAFASKNSIINSIFDALGMGIGFTIALIIISFIRELFGTLLFDFSSYIKDLKLTISTPMLYVNKETSQFILKIFNKEYEIFSGNLIFISPAGAFFVIGLILAGINAFKKKFSEKEKK